VYPALSVLQAIGSKAQPVLWVGGKGGMEADLVQRAGIPFASIPAAGLHGVGLGALPGNLLQLAQGTLASGSILAEFKPDVLFFTGGFVAAPMAVAGRRIPTLLYVPDIEPGSALKFLARNATRIALTAPESQEYFDNPARLVVTGYPTRSELVHWDKAEGRKKLGLHDKLPILLVLGGSKGARSINRALLPALPQLLKQTQVVHISGQLDWEEIQAAQAQLPVDLAKEYHAYPYLHEEMGAALASADLAISRAGASTMGEYPLFGLPAILVPYPYAWRYQKVNADYLVSHGGALMIKDEDLPAQLMRTVQSLLGNPAQLDSMHAAMHSLHQPEAATRIAELLEMLAHKNEGNS
jgi:UDP-N-acetylglucosamine--N-acetylmuramyl-(pentapeptide) pyrophosphoryl-undecaprenol N-acetylglucosamine transferase